MATKRLIDRVFFVFVAASVFAPPASMAAEAPTTTQALSLTPIQPLVEFDTPTKEEAAKCTMRAETENNTTAWIVRNGDGEILRRFADANGDNFVDLWCYYQNGLEVYRDIDSNFNKKADQYRWFHTAGSRWGMDKDEDGRVDAWRVLSTHEVAEQVVFALKTRDRARFELLLMTPAELSEAGFGKERADRIAASVKMASAEFSKLLNEQKLVTAQSRYVDFGSARPATIPAGTAGSTKDVVVIDNASALVETNGKHEQVLLGTLVAVGGSWKLVGPPAVGGENQPLGPNLITRSEAANTQSSDGAPSDEMQKLMAELERLDQESDTLPPERVAANINARAESLMRLAELTPEGERDQWYRQLADMLSVAAQSGNLPEGMQRLEQLQKSLTDAKASEESIAHAVFQRIWAEYMLNMRGADATKVNQEQQNFLTALDQFVTQYPKSSDAPEALLQLGMYRETMGNSQEAAKAYQQLASGFPNAKPAQKGAGALFRLSSVGKPMKLSARDIQGTGTIDLGNYRNKVVLIHYWATWCGPCKDDMVLLRDFYAKKGGRDFDIIGVCLDDNVAGPKQYLLQNRFPWKHAYEAGGLDGRLANEMGILNLPHMVLVDQKGNVASNNIHVAELEGELARMLPANNTATQPRPAPVAR